MRAQVKGVSTTIDLMAGMGLKYVHATNKGRKGQMGDLEKSRDQVCAVVYCNIFERFFAASSTNSNKISVLVRMGVSKILHHFSLQLLKMGFIDKANFDEEDKHLYDKERRENSVIKEKQGVLCVNVFIHSLLIG